MKKIILTFGVFVTGILFANAQNNTTVIQQMVNSLTKICGPLTPAQDSALQSSIVAYTNTCQANKLQYANNPDSLKASDNRAHANYVAQFNAILTPAQMQKFNAYYKPKGK